MKTQKVDMAIILIGTALLGSLLWQLSWAIPLVYWVWIIRHYYSG